MSCKKQELLAIREHMTFVHPCFFHGFHVAHLFSYHCFALYVFLSCLVPDVVDVFGLSWLTLRFSLTFINPIRFCFVPVLCALIVCVSFCVCSYFCIQIVLSRFNSDTKFFTQSLAIHFFFTFWGVGVSSDVDVYHSRPCSINRLYKDWNAF